MTDQAFACDWAGYTSSKSRTFKPYFSESIFDSSSRLNSYLDKNVTLYDTVESTRKRKAWDLIGRMLVLWF